MYWFVEPIVRDRALAAEWGPDDDRRAAFLGATRGKAVQYRTDAVVVPGTGKPSYVTVDREREFSLGPVRGVLEVIRGSGTRLTGISTRLTDAISSRRLDLDDERRGPPIRNVHVII